MTSILHLTTVHPRSDVRILIKEARTLASRLPHKVWLMVADGKGNADEADGRISIYDLGHPAGGRLCRAASRPWRAFFAIGRIKPDIVHFHDPELIPLGIILRVLGHKIVYDVHEDVPRQILNKYWLPRLARKPVAWIMGGAEWFGAKAFDAIVPATPKIAERFPLRKTVTIQNFPILTVDELSSASLRYCERPDSFVYAGGISKIRGAVEMVRVFELLGDFPGVKLDLAGNFSPAAIEDTLRALPGWTSVNYHGYLSSAQVARMLGRARAGLVLLHPVINYVDSQPIKMFEYMAAGLPVIASAFPLWRQIIEGADCGLLVDPLNLQAIAEAMRWILDHPAEAEAMGRRGRRAVERIYNWDSEAVKLLDLYNRLLTH